jgi:hypothetical protein
VKRLILVLAAALILGLSVSGTLPQPIKIAQVVGATGPLEVIIKDTQGKPDVGKQMLTEAFEDDKVDLAEGGVSSAVAMALLPVAKEFKKVLIVEPAVADSITGSAWNRYIFRTGRNSSQDAVSNAVAIAKPGVVIATLAQDYAFGRDGVKAYKEAAEAKGAKVVHEEYAPINTTDFTAPVQRIIQAMKDQKGDKYLFIIWAGKGNPFSIAQMKLDEKYGIKISTGGNILAALAAMGGVMFCIFNGRIYPAMGDENLIFALIVVIIGGMGSVAGSFLGAVMVGLAFNYVAFLIPKLALGVNILIMAVILLIRPQGLMGRN